MYVVTCTQLALLKFRLSPNCVNYIPIISYAEKYYKLYNLECLIQFNFGKCF